MLCSILLLLCINIGWWLQSSKIMHLLHCLPPPPPLTVAALLATLLYWCRRGFNIKWEGKKVAEVPVILISRWLFHRDMFSNVVFCFFWK